MCLDNYFRGHAKRKCPVCRQKGIAESSIKPTKYISRIVKALQVKCTLQSTSMEEKQEIECAWVGSWGSLSGHIHKDCPLFSMTCSHCNQSLQRHEMDRHGATCLEKKWPCTSGCS